MVCNKAKSIYGNLAGTLNEHWCASTKGTRMKMIAMVVANEMCGSILWPEGGWAAGYALESFSS
jgi:hypothetical protein